MKAAYLQRDFSRQSIKTRMYQNIARTFYYRGIDGYFEEAMDKAFGVLDRIKARQALQNPSNVNNIYELLVVNYRCFPSQNREKKIRNLAKRISIPTILFANKDAAGDIPENKTLGFFDLIYKREPYKDRSRYDLSSENQKKIHPTMLPCPLMRTVKEKPLSSFFSLDIEPKQNLGNYKRDVFFSGQNSGGIRKKVWRWIQNFPDIDEKGGLQGKGKSVPDKLQFEKISRERYADNIKESRINLALDGYGELTFRHLELWYLGAFMMTTTSINDLDLLIPVEEGEHYVTFDNKHDLKRK